jgi:hypothetical protein
VAAFGDGAESNLRNLSRTGVQPKVTSSRLARPSKSNPSPMHKSRNMHQISVLKRLSFFGAEFLVQHKPMIYGYARVSADGQSVTAQVTALQKRGAGKV